MEDQEKLEKYAAMVRESCDSLVKFDLPEELYGINTWGIRKMIEYAGEARDYATLLILQAQVGLMFLDQHDAASSLAVFATAALDGMESPAWQRMKRLINQFMNEESPSLIEQAKEKAACLEDGELKELLGRLVSGMQQDGEAGSAQEGVASMLRAFAETPIPETIGGKSTSFLMKTIGRAREKDSLPGLAIAQAAYFLLLQGEYADSALLCVNAICIMRGGALHWNFMDAMRRFTEENPAGGEMEEGEEADPDSEVPQELKEQFKKYLRRVVQE